MRVGCTRRGQSASIGRTAFKLLRQQGVVCASASPGGKDRSRMRTQERRAIVVATAALLLAAAPSCAGGGDNDPAASRSSAPSSRAPTPSPMTPQSESQKASDAATALVEKYYATVDKLSQDPEARLDQLSSVATSLQLSAQRKVLQNQRKNGQRQTGATEVILVKVQSVNLDNSDSKSGKVPTVEVDVCWDVSNVDVVDSDGKSVVSPGRPDTGWTQLSVTNYHFDNDPANGWRVATGEDIERASCEAS